MDINVESIFIIIIAFIVVSSTLASISFGIYNKYFRKNSNPNIFNNINHSPPNESGDTDFNSVARNHTISNSVSRGRSVDREEEFIDALPVYEPRGDSYRVDRLDDINESIGMQILIRRPEPAHESIDRPPTYRL